MGRSRTVKYTIETRIAGIRAWAMTPTEWRSRKVGPFPGHGFPNYKNLVAWMEQFNASLKPGECNAHLRDRDPSYRVYAARIVRQEDSQVMAVTNAWEAKFIAI